MSNIQVIIFSVASELYGVDVNRVQSIERLQKITPVPRALPFIKGVTNLRGVVTPVIDLRERFSLPSAEPTDETRLVIVSVLDMVVGLTVDSVSDVRSIDQEQIEPPPSMVGGLQAAYLEGVARLDGDELLIILNLQRVLSDMEERQLKAAEKSIHG